MKKILLSLAAIACSMSMNAQIIKIMKGSEVVATFTSKEADNILIEEEVEMEDIPSNEMVPFSWTVGDAVLMLDGTNSGKYKYVSDDGYTMSSFEFDSGTAVTGDNIYALYPYEAPTSRKVTREEAEAAAFPLAWDIDYWIANLGDIGDGIAKRDMQEYNISPENQQIVLAYLNGWDIKTSPTLDGSSIKYITLSANQTLSADQRLDRTAMKKVAKIDDGVFVFNNVCAFIKVTIPGGYTNCTKIEVIANYGENLAGKFTADVSDNPTISKVSEGSPTVTLKPIGSSFFTSNTPYYIAVLPGTLPYGITVNIYRAGGIEDLFYVSGPITLKSGEVYSAQ